MYCFTPSTSSNVVNLCNGTSAFPVHRSPLAIPYPQISLSQVKRKPLSFSNTEHSQAEVAHTLVPEALLFAGLSSPGHLADLETWQEGSRGMAGLQGGPHTGARDPASGLFPRPARPRTSNQISSTAIPGASDMCRKWQWHCFSDLLNGWREYAVSSKVPDRSVGGKMLE